MTYGSSLAVWDDAGILERELALYEEHAKHNVRTLIVSYGGERDLELARRFPFLDVVCNRWMLHPRVYRTLLPLVHCKKLRTANVFKTNQMYGAHVADRCATFAGRPLVIRQGYGYYDLIAAQSGPHSSDAQAALAYEKKYFPRAKALIFTTDSAARAACERYSLDPKKLFVVPNYVIAANWTPAFEAPPPRDKIVVAYFGRLAPQKNLETLVSAAVGLPVNILLIGDGPDRDKIQRRARELDVACEIKARVAQQELPALLAGCDIFALTSHVEGHPKALIEAMAFGMPVVAADSPGIGEHIIDGETGRLCPPTPEGVRAALKELIDSRDLRARFGREARTQALAQYSLPNIASRERDILNSLVE